SIQAIRKSPAKRQNPKHRVHGQILRRRAPTCSRSGRRWRNCSIPRSTAAMPAWDRAPACSRRRIIPGTAAPAARPPRTPRAATIPTLDPELARQLGLPTAEDDEEALARPPRSKMEALGVKATADALENLIREGRPEFKGEDGSLKVWTPHRPPRPEKSEGGVRFIIKSDYEPKGDQPTAIAELVEGIQRNDRTQVLLGVTGSGKTY